MRGISNDTDFSAMIKRRFSGLPLSEHETWPLCDDAIDNAFGKFWVKPPKHFFQVFSVDVGFPSVTFPRVLHDAANHGVICVARVGLAKQHETALPYQSELFRDPGINDMRAIVLDSLMDGSQS